MKKVLVSLSTLCGLLLAVSPVVAQDNATTPTQKADDNIAVIGLQRQTISDITPAKQRAVKNIGCIIIQTSNTKIIEQTAQQEGK